MEEFVKQSITVFLVVGGLYTALAVIYAVAPQKAISQSLKLAWNEQYVILIRHWGFMVFLVGALYIWSIFDRSVLFPAMLFGAVEKAFMVGLFLANLKKPWIKGFRAITVIDSLMVIYSLLYFAVLIARHSTSLY
jgi:fructose-specific phosphotransferase system IIC component